jgi:hypothetical protein
VYLYDRDDSLNARKAPWITPLIQEGLVEVSYWPTPGPGDFMKPGASRWSQDQTVAHRHCQASARASSKWLAYLDSDEYITLFRDDLVRDLNCSLAPLLCQLQRMEQWSLAATKLPLGDIWLGAAQYVQRRGDSEVWAVNNFPMRKPGYSWEATKLIIRPDAIRECWIHSATLLPGWNSLKVRSKDSIPGTVQTPLITIEEQNNAEPHLAIRLNHYGSLHLNRDKMFLSASNQLIDPADMVEDALPMSRITDQIHL